MFISIILEPGRIYTDYGVVDTTNGILMAKCSSEGHADTIAKVLNIHQAERIAAALLTLGEAESKTTPGNHYTPDPSGT